MSRIRLSKWVRTLLQGAAASALVIVGLASFATVAGANAANPNPDTVGNFVENSDGTVTATLEWT